MRVFIFLFILISVFNVEARGPLPKSRSIFEFTQTHGSIRKLQVDLVETSGKWKALVRAKLADGKIRSGELACVKKSNDEYTCRRDDDGGAFQILLGPQAPQITFVYFTAADEGEEIAADLRSPDTQPVSIDGRKAPLSKRDAF